MLLGIMEIEKIIGKVVEKPENFLQSLAGVVFAIVAVVGILQISYFKSIWLEFPIGRIPTVTEGYGAIFFIFLTCVVSGIIKKWLTA